MSIRYLALALYEAMKKRDELAGRLERLPAGTPLEEREALKWRIKAAENEIRELRRRIDAKKDGG